MQKEKKQSKVSHFIGAQKRIGIELDNMINKDQMWDVINSNYPTFNYNI